MGQLPLYDRRRNCTAQLEWPTERRELLQHETFVTAGPEAEQQARHRRRRRRLVGVVVVPPGRPTEGALR
uniref:Uncharacterized protein n=1 Tax=Oryza brachyantha TaxID=4533 RepID=J3LYG8_ORYBR